jgi:hypothetical protein
MKITLNLDAGAVRRLEQLAERRGLDSIDPVVRGAIDRLLEAASRKAREYRTEAALSVLGTLSEEAAQEMEQVVRSLRDTPSQA